MSQVFEIEVYDQSRRCWIYRTLDEREYLVTDYEVLIYDLNTPDERFAFVCIKMLEEES